jgi:hypothetical protein
MAGSNKLTVNIKNINFDFEIKINDFEVDNLISYTYISIIINKLGLEYIKTGDYNTDTIKHIEYAIKNNKVKLEFKNKNQYDIMKAYFTYGTDCDKDLFIEIELTR